MRRGLIINCTHEHVLRLLPPFIVSERQVNDFLVRFEGVLAQTKRPLAASPIYAEADSARMLAASR